MSRELVHTVARSILTVAIYVAIYWLVVAVVNRVSPKPSTPDPHLIEL